MNRSSRGPSKEPDMGTFVAEFSGGKCHKCKKPFEEGDVIAWLWNPDRHIFKTAKNDFKVHKDCWYDANWDYFKTEDQKELRVVAQDFDWAQAQLEDGEVVRRRKWDNEKYLQMAIRNGRNVIYVVTTASKGPYSYPRYDMSAKDWELG